MNFVDESCNYLLNLIAGCNLHRKKQFFSKVKKHIEKLFF